MLLYTILIISIIALLLSVFNFVVIFLHGKQHENMNKDLKEMLDSD